MSVTYQLKYPVTLDGETFTELTLRRPKFRDIARSQKVKGELDQIATMLSDLAEVSPKVVNELDAEDFTAIGEIIGNFMTPATA
jgi:hypothetical protein